ncbi:DUF5682 family protein [Paenarthrobacter nicotinovorans]|uniref:DUF5682 family protein n=1 Tax=Paenarthrobacter nicotinovorans TaxID=29320 RepID=A0ABV0GT21_PAENI|nr:DUF5682 family protein [Paenarthrobacter nicotinovorans]
MTSFTSDSPAGVVEGSEGSKHIAATVDLLCSSTMPFLIGVRHHSAALASVIPRLLEDFGPDVLLLELPQDAQPWLEYIASEETMAPIAFAGVSRYGHVSLYPFADFSPELAAMRWAAKQGVRVICCDAPMTTYARETQEVHAPDGEPEKKRDTLAERAGIQLPAGLWDTLVEGRASGAEAEQLRRAGLAAGWAFRAQAQESVDGIPHHDLYRESHMRRTLAEVLAAPPITKGEPPRVAAVVGSFHAAALLQAPQSQQQTEAGWEADTRETSKPVVCSLVPYAFAQLDERSGYPAGISDPEWQQSAFECGLQPDGLIQLVTALSTRMARELRALGHPAGPGESREAVRLAADLASLRGKRAPGRTELLEAFVTVFAQGDVLGKGRAVARVAEQLLVGERRGAVAPNTPVSGLAAALDSDFQRLRLPSKETLGGQVRVLDLDPYRTLDSGKPALDWHRQKFLARLHVAGIAYGTQQQVSGVGGFPALTHRWEVAYSAATAATVEQAALLGVTLKQAAAGRASAALRRYCESDQDSQGIAAVVAGAGECAHSDLPAVFESYLDVMAAQLPESGSLTHIMAGHSLLAGIRQGEVAVFSPERQLAARMAEVEAELLGAAMQQVEALTGSDALADAEALISLVGTLNRLPERMVVALAGMLVDGSPLMQGTAAALLTRRDQRTSAWLRSQLSAWVWAAGNPEQRAGLKARLSGFCLAAGELLEIGSDVLKGFMDQIEEFPDRDFLDRAPAMRGGFDTLSPAVRQRILESVIGADQDAGKLAVDANTLLAWASADERACAELERLGLSRALAPVDRWRLLLGRDTAGMPEISRRYARTLDELYGSGAGEGSWEDRMNTPSGGDDLPYPGAREWAADIDELFGPAIREEVLAEAATRGRSEALLQLDPETTRPSVELLSNILALVGALPESRVTGARRLVARMVEELSKELESDLQPSLIGISLARPTFRKTPVIDLHRTILANLKTATAVETTGPDGVPKTSWRLLPDRPVFRTPAGKSSQWHVIVLVDVSGSMEASTVFAALTAAILTGVNCLEVSFVTFSTRIADLSRHAVDPLTLLLEIQVGGGTNIAGALAYAQSIVTSPQRTLLAVISDFEEGGSVSALVQCAAELHSSGVKLLGCAALNAAGKGAYNAAVARRLVAAGMPVAAVSPQELAQWVGDMVRS